MTSIVAATIAYFFGGCANLLDEVVLTAQRVRHVLTYTFLIGITAAIALPLAPFAFFDISWREFALYGLIALLFLAALAAYYYAFAKEEATRVVPIVVGFQPLFVLLFSRIILGISLHGGEFAAFVLLVAGSVLISWKKEGITKSAHVLAVALAVALLFAAENTLFKYAFHDGRSFLGVFFWTKMLAVPMAALLLFIPAVRADLKSYAPPRERTEKGMIVALNKILGGLATVIYRYAMYLGNIAILSAMGGIQYFFLFLLTMVVSKKYPHAMTEPLTRGILAQKGAAFILIGSGIALLFLWR